MRIGIIGLPLSGKKTLFTLLTGRRVPESRKPGEVVDGVAFIRDPRVDKLTELCRPERKVYAENLFVLCPDVVTGAGSREWLEAARKCDLLCAVVRAFQSPEVYHPSGSVDANRDLATVCAELLLADMELVDKRLQRIGREKVAGQSNEQQIEEKTLRKCMQILETDKPLREGGLEPHELGPIRSLGLLTLVPVLAAYNVDEADVAKDAPPRALAVSAKIEQEITAIEDPGERQEYLASIGLERPGVDRMNTAAYDALGLMSFYTVGEDEVRAWTVRKGSPAPAAAGRVHSDMERGFIRVEVIRFDDFVAAGSEHAAKAQGKVQSKGKDYVVQDGDICHFLFNV